MSGGPRVTRRMAWGHRAVPVAFMDWEHGLGVRVDDGEPLRWPAGAAPDVLLGAAARAGVERVLFTSSPPWEEWLTTAPEPEGWASAGHHLGDPPVLRWARQDGRGVELRAVSEWFDGVTDPGTAARAWRVLGAAVAGVAPGARPLASPAQTGKDTARRLLPRGAVFPVLEPELRRLVPRVQHRHTIMPPAGPISGRVELWDGRTMYGGLTGRLGSGPVTSTDYGPYGLAWEGLDRAEQFAPGFAEARVSIPEGAGPLGLLPHDGGWPTSGELVGVWDCLELNTAAQQGWGVRVIRHHRYSPGSPLDAWGKAWEQATGAVPAGDVSELVTRAMRRAVLATIGSFASTEYQVTRRAPAGQIPPGVTDWVDSSDGAWVSWREWERAPVGEWTHPEWASQIWARSRTKMLSAPTGTAGVRAGALHLPGGVQLVGIHADALVVTGSPGWPDDGRWGRLRLKGSAEVVGRAWPPTTGQLTALTTGQEGARRG